MRYKNIILWQTADYSREDELSCTVSCENFNADDDAYYSSIEKIQFLLQNFNYDYYTEGYTDDLIGVRSNDITFDEKGIEILKELYDTLEKNDYGFKVEIDVHVHGKEWFVDKDGHEYNSDNVSWEDFIKNLEVHDTIHTKAKVIKPEFKKDVILDNDSLQEFWDISFSNCTASVEFEPTEEQIEMFKLGVFAERERVWDGLEELLKDKTVEDLTINEFENYGCELY